MISLRRPSDEDVERYRLARTEVEPTATVAGGPPAGADHDRATQVIGHGTEAFAAARAGIERWAAHRGAGVEVFPAAARVVEGETVAILTRQLGLWVLAACRVDEVVDEPDRFGFTYATLPDHPERGLESFVAVHDAATDEVRFEIEAWSVPGIALVRLGSPVTRRLQHRAVDAYLAALRRWVDEHPGR